MLVSPITLFDRKSDESLPSTPASATSIIPPFTVAEFVLTEFAINSKVMLFILDKSFIKAPYTVLLLVTTSMLFPMKLDVIFLIVPPTSEIMAEYL